MTWTARVFGDDVAERVFAPLVADLEHERHAASTTARRAWLTVGGAWALGTTAMVVAADLAAPSRVPRAARLAIAGQWLFFTAAGTCLGLLPFVLQPMGPLRLAVLATLAPSVLALATPLSMLPTVAAIQHLSEQRWPSRAPWVASLFVLCGVVMGTATVGWLTPAANVEFRQRMIALTTGRPAHVERDARELSLPELLAARAPADAHWSVASDMRRRELVTRVSVAILWPVTFSWFGWRLSRHRHGLSTRAGIGWWAFAGVATLLLVGSLPYSTKAFAVVGVPGLWLLAAALLRPRVADAAAHM